MVQTFCKVPPLQATLLHAWLKIVPFSLCWRSSWLCHGVPNNCIVPNLTVQHTLLIPHLLQEFGLCSSYLSPFAVSICHLKLWPPSLFSTSSSCWIVCWRRFKVQVYYMTSSDSKQLLENEHINWTLIFNLNRFESRWDCSCGNQFMCGARDGV